MNISLIDPDEVIIDKQLLKGKIWPKKIFFLLNQVLLLLQIRPWSNPVLMVCVYSYKSSMGNVTPGVSIVSCLKFVRLNAPFVTVNAPFVTVNARKWCSRNIPKSVCKTKCTSSLFKFRKSAFTFAIHLFFSNVLWMSGCLCSVAIHGNFSIKFFFLLDLERIERYNMLQ